jgi:hypothetical protein
METNDTDFLSAWRLENNIDEKQQSPQLNLFC